MQKPTMDKKYHQFVAVYTYNISYFMCSQLGEKFYEHFLYTAEKCTGFI